VIKKSSRRGMNVYANLAEKRRSKKDLLARKKAEYLATLPKQPFKRLLFRLQPKQFFGYWFSKKGGMMALKIAGVGLLFMVLLIGGLFAFYRKDLDAIRPGSLAQRVQSTVTKYYDRSGKLLWEDKGLGNYTLVVDSKDISDNIRQATIAIEDKDFYNHGGISIQGITRSLVSNSQGNAIQGGSTLTQQLVKQVFFPPEEAQQRGIAGVPRKIKEMILAIEVERMYSKDEILNLYLNESPYGGRRNGVESGAQAYFGKHTKDLTLAEAALLAAIPNDPNRYNPYGTDPEGHAALIDRQHKVLRNMVELGYATQAQADAAMNYPILDNIKQPTVDTNRVAPHFLDMVSQQLKDELGATIVGQGGLSVYTTLDSTIQDQLQGQMADMFSGKLTGGICGNSNCSDFSGFSNGAAAIEDNQTGQVLAMVGSRDYNAPGFGQNNAALSFIQPGSSIKPLVYAQLFTQQPNGKPNYGSGSILADTKTSWGDWTPNNADGGFKGNINIRQALDWSRNIPAIKAMQVSGIQPTWELIRAMGDKQYCTQGIEQQAGLASAIGSCGTRLMDHVNAIASLARQGAYMPQSTVMKVTNSQGKVLKEFKASTTQVLDPQAAYIVSDILGDGRARAGLNGGRDYLTQLNALGVHAAAKTGTSDINIGGKAYSKDLWTVGYTSSLSMAVWLGNNDSKPLNLNRGYSTIPAMLFDHALAQATQYYIDNGKAKKTDWFTQPNGIQKINGELFPSYYNKSAAGTTAQVTFDQVSKKKATSCTPARAQVQIAVTKSVDPVSKKDILVAADGSYDPGSDDDVHRCDDAKPTIKVSVSGDGKTINGTVTKGKFDIQSIDLKVNGQAISTASYTGGSSFSVPNTVGTTTSFTVAATVVDTGYYEGVDTAQWGSTAYGGKPTMTISTATNRHGRLR